MLVAGCSMLDKDFPIYSDWKYYQFVVRSFSKDYKSGKIPYFIQYPETSIQKPASSNMLSVAAIIADSKNSAQNSRSWSI
jgi:hypothetical protein